jgi:hypothetical protein
VSVIAAGYRDPVTGIAESPANSWRELQNRLTANSAGKTYWHLPRYGENYKIVLLTAARVRIVDCQWAPEDSLVVGFSAEIGLNQTKADSEDRWT